MDVNERVQKIEDTLSIIKLQGIYGDLVDKGWDGRRIDSGEVARLFLTNATWDCAEASLCAKGREQIIVLLEGLNSTFDFYLHAFTNPIIDINGDRASAIWRLVVGSEMQGEFSIIYGNEEIEYARTEAGWLIKSLKFNIGRRVKI